MRPFEPVEHGWQSRLSLREREYLAGLLEQVSAVLAAEGPLETTVIAGSGPLRPRDGGDGEDRGGEADDDAVLAALDFETPPAVPTAQEPDGATAPAAPRRPVPADVAALLEVLLPEASEDPEVAVEVSSMNRQRLRALKHGRLTDVVSELLEPTGTGGEVLVRRGLEGEWLAAVNDVRLVLAHWLDIEDADSAQDVHDLTWYTAPADEADEDRLRRALAMSYNMLTWWQESLLAVLLTGQGPA
ncbi:MULTISPECIES: DUF2017 family protein [unclassified Actinomyces]|uniref:DUF2017 family protein n=1 Tax=unclassified Actinomyces TaxID=2609248 RepID=UPI0020181B30|nr:MULTISPECIES: DUF2017 family protein [unclassified Actinomyces]MCL3776758.1 DUF2017 family protein [Actinomyces sp. AC-20-1]MCL3789712.1 DUF2017 family protein [Actinomyces sp. 187325]MCL3791897.1 DUF2017 family protein [Actinomyces sp. 186855]MCL3794442.1 DUF2017 family protein [Actinomyces sp. 217892]